MNLSAKEKIGQRLVVGFPGTEIDSELEELIFQYKIGNFILFKHNIISASQLRDLCNKLQQLALESTGYPAFITIDQEGGMVTRLAEDSVNIPGAMAIAATNNVMNAYEAGKITGEQLKTLGVNFNLAPDVDINSNMDNPVIGVRSYGDDPKKVAEYSVAMVKGLLDSGVLASAKHFPGHGDTNVDSHLGLPQVNKTLSQLQECELVSFQAVIDAGIPAITTSHIIFPELEPEHIPATMSRNIITGLLKDKMGFQGLVVSDCMEMSAIQKYYGTIEGVKAAVKAGVDLIFLSHTRNYPIEAATVLTAALEAGELSMEEMNASVEKILHFKEKYVNLNETKLDFDVEKGKAFARQLRKDSITPIQMPTDTLPKVDANSLFLGSIPFRATNISNVDDNTFHFAAYMAKQFNGRGILTSANPEEKEIETVLEQGEYASSIVIGTYNGHLNKGQLNLVKEASKKNQNVIVFALRNPYDLRTLPENVYGIAAYEYTVNSLDVLTELLKHPFELKGRLPIQM
ncbi:glycoside hydrolase family 3 protein [Anaerocolumna aminovalerica]|uniref:glycoside hydrolase family 3 protein n=1 Tax=Anaerocolumna aminovalerica TaxID=1527 RepID=UPI001596D538|nr:glycoside hydrolase family 3 protein [Anaerocolumna aminovalerica]